MVVKDGNSSKDNKERYHFIINDLENERLACPFTLVKNDNVWVVDEDNKYKHNEISYYKPIDEYKFQIDSDEYKELFENINTKFTLIGNLNEEIKKYNEKLKTCEDNINKYLKDDTIINVTDDNGNIIRN